jgi:hypothetical protein
MSQTASNEFMHCFDLVKSLQYQPQEKHTFGPGTSKLACTLAWLFEQGHLHTQLKLQQILAHQFALLVATI